jgi:hypothetical protein
MSIAQGFVQADRGVYFAIQSGKGTVNTTLKNGIALTKFETTVEKEITEGEPMLGQGNYMQRSVGRSFKVNGTAEGWCTLERFLGFMFSMIATRTTTGSVAPFSHAYALLTRNITMKYGSIFVIMGESAVGTGIQYELVRDVRITSFSFTFTGTDAVKVRFSFEGLNEGAGPGSLTPTFDSTFVIPNPTDSTNTYTWPSWFPTAANVCATGITVNWNASATDGPICLVNSEHADIFLPKAGWSLDLSFMHTTDMVVVYNWINYGAASAPASSSGLVAPLKEGAFSFQANSSNIAGGSTPYSIAFSFPSLQWVQAQVSNATPDMLSVKAPSFGNDASMTLVNATSGTNMAY